MRRMSSSAAPVLTGTSHVVPRSVGAPQVSMLRNLRNEGAMQPCCVPHQVDVLAPHAEEEIVRPSSSLPQCAAELVLTALLRTCKFLSFPSDFVHGPSRSMSSCCVQDKRYQPDG
jgi:hypothetical protein